MVLRKKQKFIALACSLSTLMLLNRKKCKKRSKLDSYLKERPVKGRFATDFSDMRSSKKRFVENFRIDPRTFDELLNLVEPFLLAKRETHPDNAITPKQKLAATLEYFGSGTLQRHVASIYRISKQHFGTILTDVYDAIIAALNDQFPKLMKEEMVDAANGFQNRWQLPNCLGAIDGKHVSIKCPSNAGSLFYNYKGFHSIALLAVADARYRFTFLDVGAYGSESDASILANGKLGKAIFDERLNFPADARVNGEKLPFFFVGDDAFLLHKRITKPYVPKRTIPLSDAQRIFNYRLSRARLCIENAFGILCSRFYCLARIMHCSPGKVSKIVTACCFLHNFLISKNHGSYCPSQYADYVDHEGNLVEGDWRQNIPENSMFNADINFSQGRPSNMANLIRQSLEIYVNSTLGAVPWQQQSCGLE